MRSRAIAVAKLVAATIAGGVVLLAALFAIRLIPLALMVMQ